MKGTRWFELAGEGVVVHAPDGSFAAGRAHAELHELEAARAALEWLLQPPPETQREPIHVYLVDPVATREETVGDVVGVGGLVRTVEPGVHDDQITLSLARFGIARWLNENAAAVPLLAAGVAGLVAAETGTGAPASEADDHVRSLLADAPSPADAGVSILTRLEPGGPALLDPVTTSFVAFLVESFGRGALSHFLAGYDPARRDESANAAFRQPLAALEEAWLAALERSDPRRPFRDFVRHLAPLFRPYRRQLVEVGLWMLIGLGVTIAAPLFTRHLIDTEIPKHDKHGFLLVALSLLGLYLGDAVVGLRLSYVQGAVNLRVLADLKQRMFAHLQHLSHSYYSEARVGDVMVRLSQDVASIQEALAEFAGTALFMLLSAFAALGTLIYMNVWMGLLVLLAFPLMVVAYILLGTRAARLSYARQQEEGRVASIAQETLSAQGVVKAYRLEEHALGRYRARLAALVKVSLRMNLIVAALNAAVTFAFRFMTLLVIGVGGYLVIAGHFTLGTLIAFLAVLPLVFSPITMVAVALQSLQTAAGSMVRVTELLDERPAIVDAPDAVALPPARGDVALDHVTFGYDPERPVLHDLDLAVPAGSNVAIVGPSGSGKSTVANLLLRFWDPQQGAVRYDGRDAREVTLESLRGQIGLVFQDTFVFDTTVRENIGLGRPGATDVEIRAAAEGARLDGWLATLPAGYDTLLGERGVRMSGGQRQRLAIARALLRDPRILVLDEATSALDTRTEAAILESLADAARGRTTITITHRLVLAAAADRIFVLDEGRLVESGTHNELLASGGLYSRLRAEQTGGDGRQGLPRDRLRRIPLLAHLDDDRLAVVSRQLVLERFSAGEIVARQGDAGDRFYVVVRGQVDVLLEHDGREQRVGTLGEGDFFGEMALLGDGIRAATVRTAAATDIYSLSRQDLRALTEREPAIGAALLAAAAERRRALDDAVAAVGATSV